MIEIKHTPNIESSENVDETSLNEQFPPRSQKYPSKKINFTRIFYRTLLILFSALTVGLVWWGFRAIG